jgi:hypothetical protein
MISCVEPGSIERRKDVCRVEERETIFLGRIFQSSTLGLRHSKIPVPLQARLVFIGPVAIALHTRTKNQLQNTRKLEFKLVLIYRQQVIFRDVN